jgi:hypothetical protein
MCRAAPHKAGYEAGCQGGAWVAGAVVPYMAQIRPYPGAVVPLGPIRSVCNVRTFNQPPVHFTHEAGQDCGALHTLGGTGSAVALPKLQPTPTKVPMIM